MIKIGGWASIFDTIDNKGEMVKKGAFEKDLKEYNYRPMLFQHTDDKLPIGWWLSMKECERGLWVEGVVNDEQISSLILNRALLGLSIGYRPVESEKRNGILCFKVVSLLEVSVTPIPLNRDCLITNIDIYNKASD